MDVQPEAAAAALLGITTILLVVTATDLLRKPKKKKKKWVRHFISQREVHGAHAALLPSLEQHDTDKYFNFMHVPECIFQKLLRLVTPIIKKNDTNWRKSLSPSLRLSITLRFLSTGDSYQTLGYMFYVGSSTLTELIPETCQALYDVLRPLYMKFPKTHQQWRDVANNFGKRWQLPHCLGALDGKDVAIRCPRRSGSNYYNYKGFFSIVLMALVDSDYKFLYVDVGVQGRMSDGGIFRKSPLARVLSKGSTKLPPLQPMPGDERDFPFFIVGDDAFPLTENIMKGFGHRRPNDEEKINYRISRARRVVENTFGLMCSRSQVLLNKILLEPNHIDKVVLACCALYNMMREELGSHNFSVEHENRQTGVIPPAAWRQDEQLQSEIMPSCRNPTIRAKEGREYLKTYVNSQVGSVPWQRKVLDLD